MIVLEGPDSSGKTTLAERLARDLKKTVVHSGGPPKSDAEMLHRVHTAIHRSSHDVIYDRFPVISDPIYAKALGRSTVITRVHAIELSWCNPIVIQCVSPSGLLTIQNGLFDTPEHAAGVVREHERLKHYYDAYFTENPPNGKWTWDNYAEILRVCKS